MKYQLKSLIGAVKDTTKKGEAIRSSRVVQISADGSRATVETQDGPTRTEHDVTVIQSEVHLNSRREHSLDYQALPGNRFRTF